VGFYENGMERLAAVCVGTVSVTFGALPQGALEVGVGAAGLAGFILGKSARFGPECARVRSRIQKRVFANYNSFIEAEGLDAGARDLFAAHQALLDTLGDCIIDRATLAKSAFEPNGFPVAAVRAIMRELGAKNPEFFSEGKTSTLTYRYAADVVKAGIEAAVENADYYRSLEPVLMMEMANKLGQINQGVREIKQELFEIRELYHRELEQAKDSSHATEAELVSLLAFILRKRVSRENIVEELERAYSRLSELQAELSHLQQDARECPEIVPFLQQAETALDSDIFFSLDDAEEALLDADLRYSELFPDREEYGLAIGYFHMFLRHVLDAHQLDALFAEGIRKFVIIIPENLSELNVLRWKLKKHFEDAKISHEDIEIEWHNGRKMLINRVGEYLYDVPSSLIASESSPRHIKIRELSFQNASEEDVFSEKIQRLEAVIISSFFKTLNDLIKNSYRIDYRRVQFLSCIDFLSCIGHSTRDNP